MTDRDEMNNRITVFLADDNLIVREGVKTLISLENDLEVVGTASDYDELLSGAVAASPHVVVTDIRMPPTFQREGIDAALEIRKHKPGTGIVILSQYDEPEYAVALLSEGPAGFAYLLKDRLAEGKQLAHAIREVALGGSVLDPRIVEALVTPVTNKSELNPSEEDLLRLVAAGKSIKAIAAVRQTTPAIVSDAVDQLFLTLAKEASAGSADALSRLKMLHQSIVDLEEQGESLSRLLPGGVAEKLRAGGQRFGESERLVVTVLMSDIRGYSTIAESADPSVLASQLNEHRSEMNKAILDLEGNVWQFVGDAVMAVFGAPFSQEDHADRAVQAAIEMQKRQAEINRRWRDKGLAEFGLGIGLSTGEVAAVVLGSEERSEYTVIGDTVNIAQRLQDAARPAGTVLMSAATFGSLASPVEAEDIGPISIKGRKEPVDCYRISL